MLNLLQTITGMKGIPQASTLIIEPEQMRVKVRTVVAGASQTESYFLPDYLIMNEDEDLKARILEEVSLFSSRFF